MKTLHFFDNEFENNGYTHTRKVVRALVYNSKKQVALIRLFGEGSFGHRDYHETPGGGINPNENRIPALRREIIEEIGVTIKNIHFLARVIDFYNLIKRKNDNYFYICEADEVVGQHLEDYEKRLFAEIVWVDIDEAIRIYETTKRTPIANLVIQRELPILYLAKEYLKNIR